ncbi:endoribonuclease YSH1 [Cyclospora cayetanensis]|uniref:Endoribonuclease YSH1 n=1 Tax=Cyclospora cayetanensis TaxID=88456 RepID=A0A6P6RPS7_9EIME|nr:endoribonuclease YSH1 [Cyclospora cayetanensis]
MPLQIWGGPAGAGGSSALSGSLRVEKTCSLAPGIPPVALPGGKRRVCSSTFAEASESEEDDCVHVLPLGAGCEVGRSCVVVSYRGFKIMFDCGIHPAHSGIGALPLFDGEEMHKVDVCLITHFHLDHCGALPYLLTKTAFRGRVFMTQPTRLICRLLWQDYARMGRFSEGEGGELSLFTEDDIAYTLQVVETLEFRQQVTVGPAKIACYGAGHVVGACMFVVEIGGVRMLYTGDFSREQDRHVPIAEIPDTDIHVLISESTYGVRVHEARPLRERRLLRAISDAVSRGGKVLLPVFALGRAQELLLILDDHWRSHPALQRVPIFFVSPLSAKSMAVFEAFVDLCGDELRQRALQGEKPFDLRHVHIVRSLDDIAAHIHGVTPCVLLAAPGMLQSGPSRDAFEAWGGSARNLIVLTGYTVRGTLADDVRREQEVLQLPDRQFRRRCQVEVISFSAHSDYNQTRDFIERLRVPNVVLVHGERTEMKRLQEKLLQENPALSVFTPEILQSVALRFQPNRCAIAIGSAAEGLQQLMKRKQKSQIQGSSDNSQEEEAGPEGKVNAKAVAFPPGCVEKEKEREQQEAEDKDEKEDFDALLMMQPGRQPLLVAAAEMEALTGVACASLQQQIRLPFPLPLQVLADAAADIFDAVQPLECMCLSNTGAAGSSDREAERAETSPVCCSDEQCCAFLVADCVSVQRVAQEGASRSVSSLQAPEAEGEPLAAASLANAKAAPPSRRWIEVCWNSSPTADLVADSLLFLACDLLRPTLRNPSATREALNDSPTGGTHGCKIAQDGEDSTDQTELLLLQVIQQHLEEHFGEVLLCRKRRQPPRSTSTPSQAEGLPEAAENGATGPDAYEEVPLAEVLAADGAVEGLCLTFYTAAEQTATAANPTATADPPQAATPPQATGGCSVHVCVDFFERQVHCTDASVQERVRSMVSRVEKAFLPLDFPY